MIIDNNEVASNESGLTGEPTDVKKSKSGDCFLLSSCLITEGKGCRAMVIGIGKSLSSVEHLRHNVSVTINLHLSKKKLTLNFAFRNVIPMGQN